MSFHPILQYFPVRKVKFKRYLSILIFYSFKVLKNTNYSFFFTSSTSNLLKHTSIKENFCVLHCIFMLMYKSFIYIYIYILYIQVWILTVWQAMCTKSYQKRYFQLCYKDSTKTDLCQHKVIIIIIPLLFLFFRPSPLCFWRLDVCLLHAYISRL